MLSVSPGYGTVKTQTLKTTSLGMSKNHTITILTGEETTFELTGACTRPLNTMTTATRAHETLVSFDCII